MFVYRPAKGSIWGHALRPKDPHKAAQKLRLFFETYFEGPYQLESTGAYELAWKESVLPNIDWDPSLLLPENERFRKVSFLMSSLMGDRVSFMLGLHIPISPSDRASYVFLKNFCRDAPFKFNAKHFKVGVPAGKKGKLKYVKANGEIATQLASAVETNLVPRVANYRQQQDGRGGYVSPGAEGAESDLSSDGAVLMNC